MRMNRKSLDDVANDAQDESVDDGDDNDDEVEDDGVWELEGVLWRIDEQELTATVATEVVQFTSAGLEALEEYVDTRIELCLSRSTTSEKGWNVESVMEQRQRRRPEVEELAVQRGIITELDALESELRDKATRVTWGGITAWTHDKDLARKLRVAHRDGRAVTVIYRPRAYADVGNKIHDVKLWPPCPAQARPLTPPHKKERKLIRRKAKRIHDVRPYTVPDVKGEPATIWLLTIDAKKKDQVVDVMTRCLVTAYSALKMLGTAQTVEINMRKVTLPILDEKVTEVVELITPTRDDSRDVRTATQKKVATTTTSSESSAPVRAVTGLVMGVNTKSNKAGKTWFGIQVDGTWYNTFSEDDRDTALECQKEGKPIDLTYTVAKRGAVEYRNVAVVKPA